MVLPPCQLLVPAGLDCLATAPVLSRRSKSILLRRLFRLIRATRWDFPLNRGFCSTDVQGDTQWYFSTTFPSLPSDTDHASKSSAILFSNHNLSTQGAWHFVDAYLENSFSGPSLTDGLPNRATTESAVSPRLTELKASWRFVRTYMQVARYKNTTAPAPPTVIVTQLNRIRCPVVGERRRLIIDSLGRARQVVPEPRINVDRDVHGVHRLERSAHAWQVRMTPPVVGERRGLIRDSNAGARHVFPERRIRAHPLREPRFDQRP